MSETAIFTTFNAKKMSPVEVADSFVVPSEFRQIASADHCYLIGARGSGKTTLLRMMHGESLMAWRAAGSEEVRRRITFSTIFLPADELWASQASSDNMKEAFTAQMLYAFLDTCLYRMSAKDSQGNRIHNPVRISSQDESEFVRVCSEAWGLDVRARSILSLQERLDRLLGQPEGQLGSKSDSIGLLALAIRAFNRMVGQANHRWALLLDEMELAPKAIHDEVSKFVRGGPSVLILKLSMSPFDRYTLSFGSGGPAPGHDFQTVYLSGRSEREVSSFTGGLWKQELSDRGLRQVSMSKALGRSSVEYSPEMEGGEVFRMLTDSAEADATFARWLSEKSLDIHKLDQLTYNQRSASIRKVSPLLVFRNAVLSFNRGRPVRRSRKKSVEPFTGARAVTRALEGNPRWIKIAFNQMLAHYDPSAEFILRGFQYDALADLGNRFEALLRVLPARADDTQRIPVLELVDLIATHLHERNTGDFNSDAPNSFRVDHDAPDFIVDAIVLGLYAGAFVHVRGKQSPAMLSEVRGERFRLTYLLGVRDRLEYPLRLGRPVMLSRILWGSGRDREAQRSVRSAQQLSWDLE